MSEYLLSFVIPTYNRASYLAQILGALAEQSVGLPAGSIEVVVLDNASTDNTAEVCRNLAPSLPAFRYHRNDHNIGVEGNVLLCPEIAQGEWIWMFGDDDILLVGAIPHSIKLLRDATFDVVLLNYAQSDRSGTTILNPTVVPITQDREAPRMRDLIPAHCTFDILGFLSSIITRRGPLLAVDSEKWNNSGSYYGHAGRLIEGFSDRPAYYLGSPILVQRQNNTRSGTDDATIIAEVPTGVALLRLFLVLVERGALTIDELTSMRNLSGVGTQFPFITTLDWVIKFLVKEPLVRQMTGTPSKDVHLLWPIADQLPASAGARVRRLAELSMEAATILRRYQELFALIQQV